MKYSIFIPIKDAAPIGLNIGASWSEKKKNQIYESAWDEILSKYSVPSTYRESLVYFCPKHADVAEAPGLTCNNLFIHFYIILTSLHPGLSVSPG